MAMKLQFKVRNNLTLIILIASIISQFVDAQRGPCIEDKCTVSGDECYDGQCYEVLGECDESGNCDQEDSKCVDTTERKNVCILLTTPKAVDTTDAPTTTASDCFDVIPTCSMFSFLCTNRYYQALMAKLCRLTCNFCGTPISTTTESDICQDKATPGSPSDCSKYPHLCKDPIYEPLMKDQCPKTCGYCGSTTVSPPICEDKKGPDGKSSCEELKPICYVPIYQQLMLDQCPLTCGFC